MVKPNSYAKSKGKIPFDWNNFLIRAKNNIITVEEFQQARILAHDWVTCGCGNQCDIIPRNQIGAPKDKVLWLYGVQFSNNIKDEQWETATKVLEKIESRSAYLIAQIKGKEATND